MRRRCAELFLTFFKIGLFTFGGGYAMISLIEDEIGRKRRWIDADELTEVFAVAESTPGPIAVNCATYVGFKQAGTAGAACATLGVVLPSFIIIYAISLCLDAFLRVAVIANAFKGIQAAVALLILRAGFRLIRGMPKQTYAVAACALSALAIVGINFFGLRLSTIWLIVGGAAAGIALFAARREGRRRA